MQVTIRPLQEQDAYTSVMWRNDPEVFKYTGNVYRNVIKIENEIEWIRKIIDNNNNGLDYRCAILVDNIYVGNIYLTNINRNDAIYHIFIGNKNYWGKGVAKEASFLILHYAFEVLNLNSVYLRVRKNNQSAYNLYKRIGFIETDHDEIWVTMKINENTLIHIQ